MVNILQDNMMNEKDSEYGVELVVRGTKNDPPDISVIIPVYNVALYLDEAIGSVVGQSFKNIEIICINDGSTDDSLDILIKWAKTDDRIAVYSQENHGLSVTRNVGLDRARGKYIYFMDSDDILMPDALRIAFDKIEELDLEVLCFNAEHFSDEFPDRDDLVRVRKHEYEGVFCGLDLFVLMNQNKEYRSSVWMYLYRKSFLSENSISYIDGILYEDRPFSIEVYIKARRMSCISDTLYKRRIRSGSITSTAVTYKHPLGYLIGYLRIAELEQEYKNILTDEQEKQMQNAMKWSLEESWRKYQELVDRYHSEAKEPEDDIRMMGEIINGFLKNRKSHESLVSQMDTQSKDLADIRDKNAYYIRKLNESFEKNKDLQMKHKEEKCRLENNNIRLRSDIESLRNELTHLKEEKHELKEEQREFIENNRKLVEDKQITENENQRLRYELYATRTSFSCRLGLALTSVPRKLMRFAGLRKEDGSHGTKKNHILLVTHELTYTGAPAALLRMAKGLKKLGYKVDIWSFLDGEFRSEFEKEGFSVTIVPYPNCDVSTIPASVQSYQLIVANTIFTAPFAYLVMQYANTVLYLREAMNLPGILTGTSLSPDVISDADHVTCVSDYAGEFIYKEYHPKDLMVLPDHVEDEYVDTHNTASEKDKRVCFIISGSLEPRKGQKFAIEAFRQLPDEIGRQAELHIIGRRPEWSRNYWEKLPSEDTNIFMHEEITDRQELISLYKSMDVFLIPSTDESLSLVALEGAMLGKPVIMSDHVGAKTYFASEDVFPSGDSDALRNLMTEYIVSDEKRTAAGIRNRLSYEQNMTEDIYLRELACWIDGLIYGKTGGVHRVCVSSVNKDNSDSILETSDSDKILQSDPLVSVVIPVYNSSEYIDDCISMIKKQTLSDYEVLLIDDCSTDNTVEMIRKGTDGDPRFRVITSEKRCGAGAARNTGIDEACGKYIIFLDADDIYSPRLLERASDNIQETQADIVAYDFERIYSDGRKKERVGVYSKEKPEKQGVFHYTDYPDRIMSVVNPTPWNKMYDRSFIVNNGLRYDEIMSTNDIAFSAVSVAMASKVAFFREVLYGYRIGHGGTITASKRKDCNSMVQAVLSAYSQVSALPYFELIRKSAAKFIIDNLIHGFDHYIEDWSKAESRQYYQSMREIFLSDRFDDDRISEVGDRNKQLYYAVRERTYEEFIKLISRKIIVSFTSYPARFSSIPVVVDNLLSQTHPADDIILWLSRDEIPGAEKSLPKDILRYVKEGKLKIQWIDKSLRPHNKYFYALQQYRDEIVITVDDDLYYPDDMIDQLLISYLRFPQCVSARRVHMIAYEDTGRILPYKLWPRETDYCIYEPSFQLLATGIGGVLYPPAMFDDMFFDEKLIEQLCLPADDLWLKLMELHSHIPVVLTSAYRPLKYVENTQETALAKSNVDQNMNDVYINNIRQWYDSKFGEGAFFGILKQKYSDEDCGMDLVCAHYQEMLKRGRIR